MMMLNKITYHLCKLYTCILNNRHKKIEIYKQKRYKFNNNTMNEVKEIDSIIFGIFSAKEIVDISVCKIDSSKPRISDNGPGSVYDPRMGGRADQNLPCVTCNMSPKECPGHFGHIELNEYIIHPLFYRYVVSYLRCFCIECNRLLITKDQMDICGLTRFKGERRFKKIIEKLEKVDICCRDECNHPQPKFAYSTSDNTISMIYKEKIPKEGGGEGSKKKIGGKKEIKTSITLSVDEIKKMFDAIPDEDVILCGFDPSRIHPKNLILSVFPVLPPCARPFVLANGSTCDDDLTCQLLEIIKANNILASTGNNEIPDEKTEVKRQKALQSLKFRIATFYNNSQGKAKHPTNGRPIKGLKERLTGKEGQIRNNHMGKRVEFSGRTVIGGDPNLRFGEMGMPKKIAEELTVPERVTVFNKEYLTKLVNNGKANFLITNNKNGEPQRINLKYATIKRGTRLLYGDTVIRGNKEIQVINDNVILKPGDQIKRDGKIMEQVKYSTQKQIHLKLGDEVHRHARNGDICLLNRQPTLHKGSMLAKRIRVMPGKTFCFNLASTSTFNADFDRLCQKQGA